MCHYFSPLHDFCVPLLQRGLCLFQQLLCELNFFLAWHVRREKEVLMLYIIYMTSMHCYTVLLGDFKKVLRCHASHIWIWLDNVSIIATFSTWQHRLSTHFPFRVALVRWLNKSDWAKSDSDLESNQKNIRERRKSLKVYSIPMYPLYLTHIHTMWRPISLHQTNQKETIK